MSDVANVIVGFGALYLAPKGTALPSIAALPIDWSAFTQPGYTDDGVEWDYTPTFKDIMVDEELGPVQKKLTAEKLIITVKLAETTLQNLYYAITGSKLPSTDTLQVGSATDVNEFVLGFQGPSPSTNATRVLLVYRVVSIAAVKAHYQRKDKVVYACQFEALADSSQPAGERLAIVKDF